MPTFVLDTDKIIEAQVQAFYPWEKTAKGLIELRWWAKKVQYNFLAERICPVCSKTLPINF